MDRAHAFVTFRVAGDQLNPSDVTQILGAEPTEAHRKGDLYGGKRTGRPVKARTGIWFFSTDTISDSGSLGDHLGLVRHFLDQNRIGVLRDFLKSHHFTATLTCFWHGEPNASPPSVPDDVRSLLRLLPANIETDFNTRPRQIG